MHEWVESEIPAILLGLIIILIVSLGFAHQVTLRSSRKEKTVQKSAEEDSTKAEADSAALADYKSMLATNSLCAICQNPTTRRCSRCKSVRYCSSACQGQDWREGHRKECRAPDTSSLARSGSDTGNGRILQRAQIADSKNLLDSLSSRSSRIDSNCNSADFSHSNGEEVKLSQLEKPVYNPISSDGNLSKPKQILFPYDYFVELFNWDLLSLPCGLINCGNSCFANVVLQCLTYTRPLTAYLLEGGHGEDCRRNDWCFMCELQSHVWKVTKNQNAFSPIRILSRIRNIGGNLGYGRQEDAHEFMRFAIDSMQSICLDEVGGEKVVDPATQETTLIHHIFGGHLQSQVKCLQCQHESNRYENMMDLAVEIHGFVESLEDAIAQFTTPEMLDGENKYKCDRCNAYVKARKRLTVHEAPNIMTIALKRFQSGRFGKLNKRVTFPDVLDMAPYMSGKGDIPPVYRLYAVVVHVDMLNASFFGHYICYVKDSNGVWYKIDDSKVKEVELDKVMSQRAYMLFYSRSVARKAPLTEGQSASPATVPVSVSTIDMDRLTVPIEPQRSSIFPPTLGTVAVPTDLTRGYSAYEALTPDPEEDESDVTEHQEVLQRADASGKDVFDDVGESSFETKETDLEPTSTGTSEGEELSEDTNLYNQSVSSLEASATDLEFRSTNGQAATSQFSDSIQFLNGIVEQNGVSVDSTGDSLDRGGKRTHDGLSYFSGPRLLDTDPSPVLAVESNDRSFSQSDSGGTSSSLNVWPKGVADLVSSSVCSMLSDGPAVSLEHRGQSSVEADTWKDKLSARAKRQHLELSSGRLGYTGPRVDGNCRLMEIDGDIEDGESHKISERFLEVLPGDCAGEVLSGQVGHEMQGGRGLIQSSSKDLLELESLCGQSAYQESHSEGLLRGEVSAPAIRIPWVSTVPFLTETTPGESNNVAQPSQGRVLIEELPEPITNSTDIREVSKEEVLDCFSFDLKTVEEVIMEDDAPYMIMEPISIEPEQFEELPNQREEMVGQASEETVSDVQEITKEKANAAASSGEPLESSQIEQGPQEGGAVCRTEGSPVDILKTEKQIIKPLIAPGFFNRSPRPRSAKSLNKKVQVITTAHENEGTSQSENIQVDTSGETGHAGIAQNGTEAGETEKQVPNGKPSSQVTSNGNHSNGKTSRKKESIDPASDIKTENGECSATGKHKQGRNESCACGSQQKWKKCCGKASGIKGGLPARRLVV